MSARTSRILTVNGRLGVIVLGNGVQVAYIVALVNVVLQLVESFGVPLTDAQVFYIVAAVNLLLAIGSRAVKLAHDARAVRDRDEHHHRTRPGTPSGRR